MEYKMTVVVTGATGFIGTHLVDQLLKEKIQVVAVVRENSAGISRLPVHPALHMVKVDFSDIAGWYEKIVSFRPNIFYHLAWSGVGNRERNSLEQIRNIQHSIDTLLLAKKLGCSKWVGAGSQAEYGPLNRKINEGDNTNPTTMYGASKLAVCNLVNLIGTQLGIQTVWLRIFSTYGPGDHSGWMLIDLINNLLIGQSPKLTEGKQIWDYLHVSDAANGIMVAGTSQASGIYNLGSGVGQPLRDFIEVVHKKINPNIPIQFGAIPYRPDQVMHLEADISKFIRDTGWKPQVSFDEGIKETIAWIRSH